MGRYAGQVTAVGSLRCEPSSSSAYGRRRSPLASATSGVAAAAAVAARLGGPGVACLVAAGKREEAVAGSPEQPHRLLTMLMQRAVPPYQSARSRSGEQKHPPTCTFLAERVGSEPTVGCPTHDFQSCRFGRSRTPPASDTLAWTRHVWRLARAGGRARRSGPAQRGAANRVRA